MSSFARTFACAAAAATFILGATALPVQAAGLTPTQIAAIISLLQSFGADQSTIGNVQLALTGNSSGTQPQAWCHTFSQNLKVGDANSDVAALREALTREGFPVELGSSGGGYPGIAGQTQIFDDAVAAAVTGFQEKYASSILTPNGISHGTGYIGAATRARLNQLYGCGNQALPPSGGSSVTILSPIADARLVRGTTAHFSWSPTTGSFYLGLVAQRVVDSNGLDWTGRQITIRDAVAGGSYDWQVGDASYSNYEVVPDGTYLVTVCTSAYRTGPTTTCSGAGGPVITIGSRR